MNPAILAQKGGGLSDAAGMALKKEVIGIAQDEIKKLNQMTKGVIYDENTKQCYKLDDGVRFGRQVFKPEFNLLPEAEKQALNKQASRVASGIYRAEEMGLLSATEKEKLMASLSPTARSLVQQKLSNYEEGKETPATLREIGIGGLGSLTFPK